MSAGSCWEAQVGATLDIETRCMQEIVERRLGNQIWSQMNARSCSKHWVISLDIEARWMQEVVKGHRGGSWDIETRWTQDVLGRLGGSLDIETRWMQEVQEFDGRDLKARVRHWNQMSARGCWETRGPEGKSWDQVNECRDWEAQRGGKFRHRN